MFFFVYFLNRYGGIYMEEDNQTIQSSLKNRTKKKRIIIIILSILSIFLVIGTVYGISFYDKLKKTGEKILIDVEAPKVDLGLPEEKLEPITVLLLGVDVRKPADQKRDDTVGDVGRTDTMILVTINPQTKTTKMVSVPRDIRVQLQGRKDFQKINSAYTFSEVKVKGSGPQGTIAQLNEMFGTTINYVVQINFEGFAEFVDAVGGVTVNNEKQFTYYYEFAKGEISLNGDQALIYVRMRKMDVLDDVGRTARQRQVIEAIIDKTSGLSLATNYSEIFDAVGNNLKTNLTISQIFDLQKKYRPSTESIEEVVVNTTEASIDEPNDPYNFPILYQRLAYEERMRIANLLREHIGLEPFNTSNFPKNADELDQDKEKKQK